jgi:hypothetical protein
MALIRGAPWLRGDGLWPTRDSGALRPERRNRRPSFAQVDLQGDPVASHLCWPITASRLQPVEHVGRMPERNTALMDRRRETAWMRQHQPAWRYPTEVGCFCTQMIKHRVSEKSCRNTGWALLAPLDFQPHTVVRSAASGVDARSERLLSRACVIAA